MKILIFTTSIFVICSLAFAQKNLVEIIQPVNDVRLAQSASQDSGLRGHGVKRQGSTGPDLIFANGFEYVVNVLDFGAVGNADFFDEASLAYYSDQAFTQPAVDSTDAINNAVAYAVDNGHSEVFIPGGNYLIRTVGQRDTYDFEYSTNGGIQIKSNLTLTLSPETLLVMNPTSAPGYAFISVNSQENVTIRGGRIRGDRAYHIGDDHNYAYGINVANGSQHILIENMDISDCEDDGIMIVDYLEWLTQGRRIEAIEIRNVRSHHNGRQGLTIANGSDITVINNDFSFQTKHSPMSGIDIELESYDHQGVSNVTIANNTFIGNAYAAIVISDMFNNIPGSLSHNVEIRNNTVEGVQLGIYAAGRVNGLTIADNIIDLTCTVSQNCAALASTSDGSSNVLIQNNEVWSDSSINNYTVGAMTWSNSPATVSDNLFVGQDIGVVVGGQNATITRNEIRDFQTEAIMVYGDPADHMIFDNIIIPPDK